MAIDIHWIRDNDSLGQFCAEWQQLPFVALDTEFMRVDTFTLLPVYCRSATASVPT